MREIGLRKIGMKIGFGFGFSSKEENGSFGFSSKVMGSLVAAVAASAFLAGCGSPHSPSKNLSLSPVSAATAIVERASLPDRLTLYGTVTADRSAAVSSRVTANVVAVRARVGQSVAAGDVLVEIDPQTAKGQEAQARGALAQARAALS
ncbi:MAG: hypothetical protein ACXWFS_07175, partial [Thermoanaerobaculia bacterium]